MKAFSRIVLFLAALALAACGTAIRGKIYDLDDATILGFEIERSYGTGEMRATNPKTGEKFQGQYTGTYNGGGMSTSQVTNWQTGQSATVNTFHRPTSANAGGVLIGDKGTVIEIFLTIRPGLVPKGHGTGQDNKGRRYQVQF